MHGTGNHSFVYTSQSHRDICFQIWNHRSGRGPDSKMIRDVRGKEEGDKHISREILSKYIVCI